MKIPKEYPVCKDCKSEVIWVESTATWDNHEQDWVMDEVFAHTAFCLACDDRVTIEWKELEDE